MYSKITKTQNTATISYHDNVDICSIVMSGLMEKRLGA